MRVQVAAWDLAMVGFAFVPVLLGRPAWGAWLGSSWRGWPQRAEGGRERVCFADLHFLRGGDQLSASGGRVSEEQRSVGRPTTSPCCAVARREAEGALWGPL